MREDVSGVGKDLPLRVGLIDLLPDPASVVHIELNHIAHVHEVFPREEVGHGGGDVGLVD